MSEKTNLNFHSTYKLFKHLDKLCEWDNKGDTYPILVDIDLTNRCNQKCPLCIRTEMDKSTIPLDKVKDIVLQLKEVGVKSFGLGGGGDPTCHPDFAEILRFINTNGMKSGVYTNGYTLTDDLIDTIINCCTYIRISLDSDGHEIYKMTHGMDAKAFYQVIENIRKLVLLRDNRKKDIVIGVGYLVGPSTAKGIYGATKLVKELGVDYIRVRPFFRYNREGNYPDAEIEYMLDQLKKCSELQNKTFAVSYPQNRWDWMTNIKRERPYKICYSHYFVTLIGANQKVYPCCHLSNNEKYCYGDLKQNTFKEVWNSQKRKDAYKNIDFKDCPNPCMLDNHNRLLWNIKQPIMHSDFL